jgi:hypothetical protein
MTIEDILSPEELEEFFLEERANPSLPHKWQNTLSDRYVALIGKYITDEDQGIGVYRALTYLAIHLKRKVVS